MLEYGSQLQQDELKAAKGGDEEGVDEGDDDDVDGEEVDDGQGGDWEDEDQDDEDGFAHKNPFAPADQFYNTGGQGIVLLYFPTF